MKIARENANLGAPLVVGFVEDEASAVTSASGAEITRRELSSLVPPSGPDGVYRMGADIASMCSNIVVVVVLRLRCRGRALANEKAASQHDATSFVYPAFNFGRTVSY
ncbi:hypothetical protein I7I51_02526 [Histoplasma capsulatum]|uniref:Uncharacterized protein n=1 Tax=Ajellomyces capsulatus TaxID=5037 RepID=A0A8A1M8F6_AJECA|nr:hypothetical protein I7I51_02526 [Histoplasma capsulatum]